MRDAVINAGAVRFRAMLLTAGAVVLGSSVILDDPIFLGLALSLMAGEVASTLLSRLANSCSLLLYGSLAASVKRADSFRRGALFRPDLYDCGWISLSRNSLVKTSGILSFRKHVYCSTADDEPDATTRNHRAHDPVLLCLVCPAFVCCGVWLGSSLQAVAVRRDSVIASHSPSREVALRTRASLLYSGGTATQSAAAQAGRVRGSNHERVDRAD